MRITRGLVFDLGGAGLGLLAILTVLDLAEAFAAAGLAAAGLLAGVELLAAAGFGAAAFAAAALVGLAFAAGF
ncbi:MAG: hypothetical protein R3B96_17635 [Pirellulaceae bacterium]